MKPDHDRQLSAVHEGEIELTDAPRKSAPPPNLRGIAINLWKICGEKKFNDTVLLAEGLPARITVFYSKPRAEFQITIEKQNPAGIVIGKSVLAVNHAGEPTTFIDQIEMEVEGIMVWAIAKDSCKIKNGTGPDKQEAQSRLRGYVLSVESHLEIGRHPRQQ